TVCRSAAGAAAIAAVATGAAVTGIGIATPGRAIVAAAARTIASPRAVGIAAVGTGTSAVGAAAIAAVATRQGGRPEVAEVAHGHVGDGALEPADVDDLGVAARHVHCVAGRVAQGRGVFAGRRAAIRAAAHGTSTTHGPRTARATGGRAAAPARAACAGSSGRRRSAVVSRRIGGSGVATAAAPARVRVSTTATIAAIATATGDGTAAIGIRVAGPGRYGRGGTERQGYRRHQNSFAHEKISSLGLFARPRRRANAHA